MNLIFRSQPTAWAYFFRVVSDGACFPADSKRETALFVVPINSATASWVRPDFERADNISRTRVYSSSRSLYALLNPSRFRAFLRNALWSWETGSYFNSTILYLLHPFPGYLKFLFWCVRCLRHAQTRPEFHQQLHNPCIIGQYAVRPAFDLSFNPRMEVDDGITHSCQVSIYANICQRQLFKRI